MSFGPEMDGNVQGSKYRGKGAKGLPPQQELMKHGSMSGTKHRRGATAKRGRKGLPTGGTRQTKRGRL